MRFPSKIAGVMCIMSLVLLLTGCPAFDSPVDRSLKNLFEWTDGMVECPPDDGEVEAHLADLPKLVANLRNALQDKERTERITALLMLRQYMRKQLPRISSAFSNAQLIYIVFGVKTQAWSLDSTGATSEMGGVTGGLPEDKMPTQEEWRHYLTQIQDMNANGISDANDPAMKQATEDLLGLPLNLNPYDHSGLLRHQAGHLGAAARYHGLVPVDHDIPVFASVAEAAEFLATNIYLRHGDASQTKAVIDTDLDGLTDSSENLGWDVVTFDGYQVASSTHVTSDPLIADTDGDGLLDSEEHSYNLDPRNPDTDGDGLTDYDEVHVYLTNAKSVDSDSDARGYFTLSALGVPVWEYIDPDPAFYDNSEMFNAQSPTSPLLWDTDGDSRSDRSEAYAKRPPRVSDVPQLKVEVTGDPELIILDQKENTVENMDQHLSSTQTEHTESTTNSWNIGVKLKAGYGGKAFNLTASGAKKKGGKGFSASGQLSGGYSHTKEVTDTTTNLVEDIHQTIVTNSTTIGGFTLKAPVKVTNVSKTPLSANVTNLVINCVYQVPDGVNPPAIKYLEMTPSAAMSGWSLSPGSSTTLEVTGTEMSASGAEDITNTIGSGSPIMFTIAQCAMTATNGSNISGIMENVAQAACAITLDFGPYFPGRDDSTLNRKPQAYYVAANIPRISNGEVTNGLNLIEALTMVGIKDYKMDASGGLIQILGWPSDPAAHPRGFWFISSSSDSLYPDPENEGLYTYDSFEDIWLAGANPAIASHPDFIDMVWMDDQDGDGLMDATEASYGTDPNKVDTDNDGLTDLQEVNGVKVGSIIYYTNPILADTDADGLSDYAELYQWASNPLQTSSQVFNAVVGSSTGVITNFQYDLNMDKGANVYPGDFDGDGYGDFIRQEKGGWDDAADNTVQVFYGDGAGRFVSYSLTVANDPNMVPNDWFRGDPGCSLIVGDFNGDKIDDFMRQEKGGWDNDATNTVQLYLSIGTRGAGFNLTGTIGAGQLSDWNNYMRYDNGAYMYAGDFNGDGVCDILRQEHAGWGGDTSGTAIVYYGVVQAPVIQYTGYLLTSTGALTSPQANLQGDPGAKIVLGDFNGDGRCDFLRQEFNKWDDDATSTADIYFATTDTAHFNVVEVTSSGYYDNPMVQLGFDKGAYVVPGDFNGDGKCDFIRQERGGWANDTIDTVMVYTGNGDGSFVSKLMTTTGHFTNPKVELSGNICEIKPFDFNGDGHCDFMRRVFGNSYNGIDNASIYFTAYN